MALVEINLRPDDSQLRGFGIGAAVIFGLFGWYISAQGKFLFWEFPESAGTVATVLWVVAGLCLVDSLTGYLFGSKFRPVNLPVYLLITIVAYPIGFVLSFVLLGVLFFGLITPLGLFFRLIGRDPLNRRLQPDATTYWEPHKGAKEPARYFKQY